MPMLGGVDRGRELPLEFAMAVLPPFARKGALIALFCVMFVMFGPVAALAHARPRYSSPTPDAGVSTSLTDPETSPSTVPAVVDDQESDSGASALLLVGFGTLVLIGLTTWLLTLRRERPGSTR